jgi:hypothetical protein
MENDITKDLKDFFNNSIQRYGEEVTYAIATWKPSIKESINYYSNNKFDKYDDKEIYKELIRNMILCNESDNMFVNFTKKMVAANDIESLYNSIQFHEQYKDAIVKAYIKYAHVPYEKRIERSTDENKVLFLNKVTNYDGYKEYVKTKKKKR